MKRALSSKWLPNWSSLSLRTVEPIPLLSHPKGKESGYLYTNHLESVAESCSQKVRWRGDC